MTRQPAAEKRLTVAWPMPRLAPVSSMTRRGVLDEDGMVNSWWNGGGPVAATAVTATGRAAAFSSSGELHG